jgi:hypothetical protein
MSAPHLRRIPVKKGLLLAVVMSALIPVAAQAAIINDSSSFDVAYGFTDTGGGWNASETSATNTPTTATNGVPFTVGNFDITVSAAGSFFATVGVRFPGRVLTNYDGTNYPQESKTSHANEFAVSVTYTGPAGPLGTIPGSEQVSLAIDSISIYALKVPTIGTSSVHWVETTAGHTGSGPSVALIEDNQSGTASNYTNVAWTTTPDLVVLGATGTTITRFFEIPPGFGDTTTDESYNSFDGFIVAGVANFSYAIPEPASLGLLALGSLAIFGRRRSATH